MTGGGVTSEGRNKIYAWVAPVSDQADIAFTRTMAALPRDMYTANRSHKMLILPNGAMMRFKSADRPDTLYGEDNWAVVVDEASRVKETAWHAIRSTLTYTQGPIRLIGNVRGRKNWFYQLSRRAQQGEPDLTWHRIIAHDAIKAGVLATEEIEQARRIYPEHVFRELYLAEAGDEGDNPFGIAAIHSCIGPLSGREPRCWGWDLAKHQDYTVGIALDDRGHTVKFERFQRPWEETVATILRVVGRTPCLVDSTGVGDPILERLQRDNGGENGNYMGYHFHPASKQKLMEGLALAIQSQDISFPAGDIVFELEQFQYEVTPNSIRYSAPDGFYDDCVCALALAQIHRTHVKPRMHISAKAMARARERPGRHPFQLRF